MFHRASPIIFILSTIINSKKVQNFTFFVKKWCSFYHHKLDSWIILFNFLIYFFFRLLVFFLFTSRFRQAIWSLVSVFWDKTIWLTSHTHIHTYSNPCLVGNRTCAGRLISSWYPTSRCDLGDKCGLHRTTRIKIKKKSQIPSIFHKKLDRNN